MIEFIDLALLVLVVTFPPIFVRATLDVSPGLIRLARLSLPAVILLLCALIAFVLHDPVPRVHDEFSYILLGDTFAQGHVASPAPKLPEFFDTFHVLIKPVYASKYFPVQGVLLAIGEKLTGHPAVGVWMSSALACAATVWMLQAWINLSWALMGGLLMALQYGIFSYWSQAYWGGMAAALGGALFFGAIRRLWDSVSWRDAAWLGLGTVLLANTRPTEGFLAVVPAILLLLRQLWQCGKLKEHAVLLNLGLPIGVILIPGALAMGMYNRAITGSSWKPPYVLHEQQYQESPQFTFLRLRPKITYSSFWVQRFYETNEMKLYLSQRTPREFFLTAAAKLIEWWQFYCGILLSAPLIFPAFRI